MKSISKQDVVERLRVAGIGPTSQRVEIAHFLFNANRHMSADQILEGVNQEYAAVSRGTVYNALGVLVDKFLVREVIAAPGKVFYCPANKSHHHIYYVEQDRLEDLPEGMVDIREVSKKIGKPPEQMDVVVRVR